MYLDLSLEEKIGQMLMVGIYGYTIDEYTLRFITKYKVGGIILFKRNIQDLEQMQNLINQLKQINKENGNVPLFISMDQEGGRVNRLPNEIEKFQLGSKIGIQNDTNYAYQMGKKTGEVLKKLGVNMNLAPVLDLRTVEDDFHFIGDRAISSDERVVANMGVSIIKGMQDSGIVTIAKHFPGHGMSKNDSHFRIPVVKEKEEKIEKHLYPFEEVCKNGVDGLLSAHMIIPSLDKHKPFTISKIGIRRWIRQRMNYNGIVMTDDLMMRSLLFYHVIGIPMKEAIESGNDILLLCKNNSKKEKAIQKLLEEVRQGKIEEKLINQSVKRILNLKEKYNI